MPKRDWKRVRPNSLVHAMRLCKEYAQDRQNLGVERIADAMGVTHDSLYKWLATGRMPACLIPTYEMACSCNFVSTWLAGGAGRIVIDIPKGRSIGSTEMVELNTSFSQALQLLSDFYAGKAGQADTQAAIKQHLEHFSWHHHNVATHATPELEFEA